MKGLISSHGREIAEQGSEIMDARGGKTFRLSVEDVRGLMGYLEENNGPNRFSKAIERKLVEEFASSLAHLLRVSQKRNSPQPKRVLH